MVTFENYLTFANGAGRNGFTSQQCDKVIHEFIEVNLAYIKFD